MKEKIKCKSCEILFLPKWGRNQKYCDVRCANWGKGGKSRVPCSACGKILKRPNSRIKRNKTNACSDKCRTNPKEKEETKRLREKGLSYREIGKTLGFGKTKAIRLLKTL